MIKLKLPERKQIRLKDYDYGQNGAYFITVCIKDRKPILSKMFVGTGVLDCPKIQLLEFGKIVDKYVKQLNGFYDNVTVEKYVIMPDHIHLLLTVKNTIGMSGTPSPTNNIISAWVSTLKRFVNKEIGQNIFQRSYYDHVIRNQQDFNEIWEYIESNPLKLKW